MASMLNPAAEFDYSPRVRELFADMKHALNIAVAYMPIATRPVSKGEAFIVTEESPASAALSAMAGSREQGAFVQWLITVRDEKVQAAHYKAYGCPHFLAACESLARWLEGRACSELSCWNWRDVEAELGVPAAKRSKLLLLSDAVSELIRTLP